MSAQIFISYRREDTSSEAGRVHSTLLREFGSDVVFMDTSSIEPGSRWPRRLEDALRSSRVILVVIGPNWLKSSNEWGERRIDQGDDWVRREIESAIEDGKDIVPILVGGAQLPPSDKLPGALGLITRRQAVEIRDAYWDHDIQLVTQRLKSETDSPDTDVPEADSQSSSIQTSKNPYPANAPLEKPSEIHEDTLKVALEGSLARWKKVVTPLPQDSSKVREELMRQYKFKRFVDAIGFMNQVAPGCDIAMHHPRWENIWKTITVYLTTWDIGHKISDRDIQLAKYFDRAFREYPGAVSED